MLLLVYVCVGSFVFFLVGWLVYGIVLVFIFIVVLSILVEFYLSDFERSKVMGVVMGGVVFGVVGKLFIIKFLKIVIIMLGMYNLIFY